MKRYGGLMRRRLAAVGLTATLVLAGCGGSEPAPEPPAESTGPAPTATTSADSDTACLLGRWHLDVADYEAQAFTYMGGLGIPVESLSITGDQILDFNESPYMAISTDLTINGVVKGVTLPPTVSQNAGGGEWGWNGDAGAKIGVDNWDWTVGGPADTENGPPLIDPSQGITVECSGGNLSVRGAGAPLTGNFVR